MSPMTFLRTLLKWFKRFLFLLLFIPIIVGILYILSYFGYDVSSYIPQWGDIFVHPHQKEVKRKDFIALKEDVEKIKQRVLLENTVTPYLKLNSDADIQGKNYIDIIARGYKGDYVRKLACARKLDSKECQWFKIAFTIKGGGGSTGFIQSSFVSEQYFDYIAYAQISQNSTIEYLWENQLAVKVKNADIQILGIYINESESQKLGILQDHLLPRLINQGITPKFVKLEISEPATISTKIAQICQQHEIHGLLYIKSDKSRIRVYLYHYKGMILYVANVAFIDSTIIYSE